MLLLLLLLHCCHLLLQCSTAAWLRDCSLTLKALNSSSLKPSDSDTV